MSEFLKQKIRKVLDFPKKGILFYDITTLLNQPHAFKYAINQVLNYYNSKEMVFDKVVAAESRGFIFGSILAHELNAGFVPLRKPGKLPHKTVKHEYALEYGKDSLEIHEDAIVTGDKVLIVDDLLATGGTAQVAVKLVEKLQGKVASLNFLIELDWLKGREKLQDYDIFSVVHYEKSE